MFHHDFLHETRGVRYTGRALSSGRLVYFHRHWPANEPSVHSFVLSGTCVRCSNAVPAVALLAPLDRRDEAQSSLTDGVKPRGVSQFRRMVTTVAATHHHRHPRDHHRTLAAMLLRQPWFPSAFSATTQPAEPHNNCAGTVVFCCDDLPQQDP